MLKDKKLAVIGVGKLGEALVKGLIKKNGLRREDIYGSVAHEKSLERAREKLGIEMTLNNAEIAKESNIIILATKPQNMHKALQDIAPVVTPGQLVITVAASITCKFIEERLNGEIPVVRAMPNVACVLNESMTALCAGAHTRKEHLQTAEQIFRAVGETEFIDESLMDGVTGLSASGPAFIYVVIEALAEAGVKLGIARDVSTRLVTQTILGTARLVQESKAHPAMLKDEVMTPAGCTIDGLLELEEGKLRVTLIKAVVKAAERARELVLVQKD